MQSNEDLRAQLAAEAAAEDDAAQAAWKAANGPTDYQDATYGCHGSHGSRSTR
ncbi:hypothetical protein [Streptomyces sp. AM 2-1-1]|uniref:hypothetical protein n=1 Tax=Streptomyces sp. AM 2-1-1 TaxID=3028709 RepID=UPI0023B88819|nr:hypothetical protein [Streptomyces sp. AM 2-1-1]WEH40590.1 hypothetical protein PZB77_14335 [Streptomyces sp. AM 2-1-1]